MDDKTVALLNEVSKNTEMGKNTVRQLLTMTDDASMRHHLQKQLRTYEDLSRRAHAMLAVEGALPKEQSSVTKIGAQLGIKVQTLRDSSPQKLAEMLIEGSHMGVTEITKALKSAEGTQVNAGAVALAQRLQAAENQYADELTSFL
ncbi:MAG: hypothetical protein RSG59_01400 [Ruthenibacterium sp.]